jgi:hypothetical protein
MTGKKRGASLDLWPQLQTDDICEMHQGILKQYVRARATLYERLDALHVGA